MDHQEFIRFQERIGYSFREQKKLKLALFHSSLKGQGIKHSDERLEFLEDFILGYCVADELFRTFRDADENELTKKHRSITCGENFARIGHELGIEKGSRYTARSREELV